MTIPDEVNTPWRFILWAEECFNQSDIFFGHGTDNARDEATYLVLCALNQPFDLDDDELNRELDQHSIDNLAELLERRLVGREPVAYLVNKAWFCGLPFYVDERVLIPRSPLAELISEQFSPWKDAQEVNRILDMGTGSGCIAIACALSLPGAKVDAVDIDADALAVAAENCAQHKVEDRVRLVRSDLFENLKGQQYDIIIANPPYVDKQDLQSMPAEFRHEPLHALEAGEDGLDIVRQILKQSRQFLKTGGLLIVEVGNSEEALIKAFPQVNFLWLEFEFGGQGVFVLNEEELKQI